ncbi:MAG: hypothetical protein ACJAVI_003678 [Candidatus Azotimanducaceae bacterium]|jgi:uncharacterized protein (TIGR00299 family) protein
MHIHLDLVGGLSGNMFVGAMLDQLKISASTLLSQIELAGFADLVKLTVVDKNDGILTGTYFNVIADDDAHHHRHYRDIKLRIEQSPLDNDTKRICLSIFHLLAVAEATVHGREVEEVVFHEVGAWDSIADIVTAAWLITQAKVTSSSASPIPLGGGRVQTAHGSLPVPAPATELLLQGFEFVDDGISGERITPTGAAILKYLNPGSKPKTSTLMGSGYGFGSKRFPGISNVVRILFFADTSIIAQVPLDQASLPQANVPKTHRPNKTTQPWLTDDVVQLNFEVDDQTPEDLSVALEYIRQHHGVYDVTQALAYGKKGRIMIAVQVLIDPTTEASIINLCFEETTTLGVRKTNMARAILKRSESSISVEDKIYRVKTAKRPESTTSKVEMDDIAHLPGFARRQLKSEIES